MPILRIVVLDPTPTQKPWVRVGYPPLLRTTELISNVAYIEMDIPKYKLKPEMLQLLPNIEFSNNDTKRLCGQRFQKTFSKFLKIRIFEKIF